ncbi:PTS sugar transporter subunit IIB [Listeria ivanovii]|uniref:Putative PTS system, IIB component n=1 Tax=Listeria ivanovii (strain ATCC BAA-678 / PAM 55) TaxID=881621 RepID=G2ZDR9_LISIP|nr:PTS lactose transporter subunit IIB [Listeria ivanovii]AHI55412.1 PTS lactose transporter subunit IIB [Listeria ivanovii WSLC3009]AIS64871.1 PTS lactose transporter subunit IIB [Listeria ivanovii subsp. ivanovii]MBC1758417.1 PTS sugar transporter subunit IIB [Listeria ivanovii]MCJ1716348.1 PTS sugar transporter subunit IIB [Listeria ivanovii]MCJ1721742.1 PTS sugar transporter subunit IIB [Listeria ivanovii]
MKNILLICGSGASSGFMAAAIRKAAKKQGEQVTVKAASEAQIDERINEIDYLLIGPHLSYMLEDLKEKAKDKDVLVTVIPQSTYGSLNGEKALELILNMEG